MTPDYTGLPCKGGCGRPSEYTYTRYCKPCQAAYRKAYREGKRHVRAQRKAKTYIPRDSLASGDSIFIRIRKGLMSMDLFGNECAGHRFTRGKQKIVRVTDYYVITEAGYNLRREWFHISRI